MITVPSLASPAGRKIYRELYRILREQRHLGAWEALRTLWAIAVRSRLLESYFDEPVTIEHPLGVWSGTQLWLEEIVSQYYYSTVVSFVYAGAAILLVVVGLRRFSAIVGDTVVMMSIGLEALLLLMLFTVMFFRGEDEDPTTMKIDELLREVGEIGRDIAASVMTFDKVAEKLQCIVEETGRLSAAAENAARASLRATSPAPELIERIAELNAALSKLSADIEQLRKVSGTLERERIELTVRRELERLLAQRLSDNLPSSP